MITRESEVAGSGCLACSIDHHHACSRPVEDDAGSWSTVYCCCGLEIDPKTAAAEEAEYAADAQELHRRGLTQPAAAGPSQPPEGSS
jgi:hypothetical protein